MEPLHLSFSFQRTPEITEALHFAEGVSSQIREVLVGYVR